CIGFQTRRRDECASQVIERAKAGEAQGLRPFSAVARPAICVLSPDTNCCLEASPGTHVVYMRIKNARFTGVLGADDGTRTHDLSVRPVCATHPSLPPSVLGRGSVATNQEGHG